MRLDTGFRAGGFFGIHLGEGVVSGGNFFLGDQYRAADRAMLALRQTGFGAGGSLGFIGDFCVFQGTDTGFFPGNAWAEAVPDLLRPGGISMGVISRYRIVENIGCAGKAIPQELHGGQTSTVHESATSDGGDTIGNGDRSQLGAAIESVVFDGGNPFRNRNGG